MRAHVGMAGYNSVRADVRAPAAAYGALMLNAALSASPKRVLKSLSEALAVTCDE